MPKTTTATTTTTTAAPTTTTTSTTTTGTTTTSTTTTPRRASWLVRASWLGAAGLLAAAVPLGLALAQPRPPAPTPARRPAFPRPAFTSLRGTVQSIGYRDHDHERVREVYVTVLVQAVSGPVPTVATRVPLPAGGPAHMGPNFAAGTALAFRRGQPVVLVYTCSLDRASPRACTRAGSHPAALAAPGPVSLTLVLADARADEVPVPETRQPIQDMPMISTQGPTFRPMENGMASSIVLEVYNGDPGALTTTPGPMLVR